MNISGFLKQSFIDYPGKIVSVVFTQGCNFRCPYCHNPELIPVTEGTIPERMIFTHLEKNRLLLDGVAITGGEPTLQPGLKAFIQKVKNSGLLVKLDTNGSNPKLIESLLDGNLLDYVAMDIKSAPTGTDYSLASGIAVSPEKLQQIKQSIRMIINSGVAHEFRTTVCRELVSIENIRAILSELEGAQCYFLQQYRNNEKVEGGKFSAYPKEEMEKFLTNTAQKVPIFIRY